MRFVVRVGLPVVVISLLAACAAPNEGVKSGSPVDVAYASALTAKELASTHNPETVYGWKLEIVGERARFFACSDERTCGERVVDVPAKSVVAVARVGRANPSRADGSAFEETDVLRLTLASDVTTSRGGVASDPHRGMVVNVPSKNGPPAR
ncbi:MAG: hypothetical protein KF764_25315 [Labilithrix sp.]|nr:hypothetical protein [Labilithrix sp.]MBX3223004.1 hypothetical protein [Labilithrix sp.]